MERRKFIAKSCSLCLGISAAGVLMSQLNGCLPPLPVFKTSLSKDIVQVPLASFKESNLVIVRDLQVPYDVLLVKRPDASYVALYMRCTHQENAVTATRDGLYCSSHGSAYDLEGHVTKEPALLPLKRFSISQENDLLIINLKS